MNSYLHIGPPVYFVIKDGYDYTNEDGQNKICTGADCGEKSFGTIITIASRMSNQYVHVYLYLFILYFSLSLSSMIAEPPSIWLDAYFEWLDPTSTCCGHAPNDPFTPCSNPDDGNKGIIILFILFSL